MQLKKNADHQVGVFHWLFFKVSPHLCDPGRIGEDLCNGIGDHLCAFPDPFVDPVALHLAFKGDRVEVDAFVHDFQRRLDRLQ